MPDEQLKAFTGLDWKNIIEPEEMCISMRHSNTRSVTQDSCCVFDEINNWKFK